jgi:dihydroflavonol-4-reductase
MTSLKVFVTGGNGFLGSRVVRNLSESGHSVRCLLREASDTRRLSGLEPETHRGCILDAASLRSGAQGCDAVVHLAGVSSWASIREQGARLEEIIVQGTRNALDAAVAASAKRFVFVSSTAAVNGSATPEIFREESDFTLGSSDAFAYSLAKRKAETWVRRYARERGIEAVIVNPCETYGPGDDELITAGNLLELLKGEVAVVCPGGTAVAHVDDVARGIVLALERGRSGERYILGGENLTLAEMASLARKIAGKHDRVLTLPRSVVRASCRAMVKAGLTPPIPLDVLEYASLHWFVDSSKARDELGYEPRPACAVFAETIGWLKKTQRLEGKAAATGWARLRYSSAESGGNSARSALIRLFAFLQREEVEILNSDPERCGEILASSRVKGTFLETLMATPAWHPIYSIESMDGEVWEQLSRDFKTLMGRLDWRPRLTPLTKRHTQAVAEELRANPALRLDSARLARLVLRILYELLFDHPISARDEELFHRASLEWRKEIAIKGKGDVEVKGAFWSRLAELVAASRFKEGLQSYEADPARWLSLFAQPFLISPQINVGDIFVTVCESLRANEGMWEKSAEWAAQADSARLGGVLLESIRLKHPFPILERSHAGKQFFILLDEFKQDLDFDPERWLKSSTENPYHAIPFAAGPRMCIGKPIAMEMMVELLRLLLTEFPAERLQPAEGHLYSGRSNDGGESWRESAYQAQVFSRALWKSAAIGWRKSFPDGVSWAAIKALRPSPSRPS